MPLLPTPRPEGHQPGASGRRGPAGGASRQRTPVRTVPVRPLERLRGPGCPGRCTRPNAGARPGHVDEEQLVVGVDVRRRLALGGPVWPGATWDPRGPREADPVGVTRRRGSRSGSVLRVTVVGAIPAMTRRVSGPDGGGHRAEARAPSPPRRPRIPHRTMTRPMSGRRPRRVAGRGATARASARFIIRRSPGARGARSVRGPCAHRPRHLLGRGAPVAAAGPRRGPPGPAPRPPGARSPRPPGAGRTRLRPVHPTEPVRVARIRRRPSARASFPIAAG